MKLLELTTQSLLISIQIRPWRMFFSASICW